MAVEYIKKDTSNGKILIKNNTREEKTNIAMPSFVVFKKKKKNRLLRGMVRELLSISKIQEINIFLRLVHSKLDTENIYADFCVSKVHVLVLQ